MDLDPAFTKLGIKKVGVDPKHNAVMFVFDHKTVVVYIDDDSEEESCLRLARLAMAEWRARL